MGLSHHRSSCLAIILCLRCGLCLLDPFDRAKTKNQLLRHFVSSNVALQRQERADEAELLCDNEVLPILRDIIDLDLSVDQTDDELGALLVEEHANWVDLLLRVVLVLRSHKPDRFGLVNTTRLLLSWRSLSSLNSSLLPVFNLPLDLLKELALGDLLTVLLQLHWFLSRNIKPFHAELGHHLYWVLDQVLEIVDELVLALNAFLSVLDPLFDLHGVKDVLLLLSGLS